MGLTPQHKSPPALSQHSFVTHSLVHNSIECAHSQTILLIFVVAVYHIFHTGTCISSSELAFQTSLALQRAAFSYTFACMPSHAKHCISSRLTASFKFSTDCHMIYCETISLGDYHSVILAVHPDPPFIGIEPMS